jgi:hypothetical protein
MTGVLSSRVALSSGCGEVPHSNGRTALFMRLWPRINRSYSSSFARVCVAYGHPTQRGDIPKSETIFEY